MAIVRLDAASAVLVVVDVQGRLARLVEGSEVVIDAVGRLVRGAGVLGVPVLATEQNPEGLGPTVEEVAPLLPSPPIPKRAFSCWGEPAFREALEATGRRDVLLAGIEAHVCVYQTAVDLREAGWRVHVAADAVSSRTAANRQVGLEKMCSAGAEVTSVETALFEMLRVAEGPAFKEVLRIVK